MKRKDNDHTIGGPKKFIAFTIATMIFVLVMQLVKPKAQANDFAKKQSDLLTDTTRINGIAYPYNLQALKPPNESPERQRQRGLIMDSIRAILKDINDSISTNSNNSGGKRPGF